MPLPFPHVCLPDVTHITPELLKTLGVSGLLLDIDGTLMQTRDAMPARPVLAWLDRLRERWRTGRSEAAPAGEAGGSSS